jgi:hypothetical protein
MKRLRLLLTVNLVHGNRVYEMRAGNVGDFGARIADIWTRNGWAVDERAGRKAA